MSTVQTQTIWSRTFILLCCAQFFGSAQHALLQPTFPLYITSLGGSPFQVGIVLACFAVTSVVFRPLIGAWADQWSEPGVSICGLSLLSAAVFTCFIPFTAATMLANALRGLGWAAMSAAGYSMLALNAPQKIRHPQAADSAPWWREILNVLDRDIILASVLSFFSHVTFPAVASFLVLYARDIGTHNIGWFYAASGATSILARPLLGKVSDNIGRRRALRACFVLQALALLMLAYAANLIALMISGMLYMVGLAMSSSTTLAIAMEQAKPERRGRAMATFSVALPLSNGVGALICGGLVQWGGFFFMYLATAILAAVGLTITVANRGRLK